jgi:hypothetical protein
VRIAALILGILGGIFGLFGSMFALTIGGIGGALGAEGADTVIGGGLFAILASIYGIVAGALALKFPKFAGWSLIAAAVVGFIAVFVAYTIAGPLMLVGGILALVSLKNDQSGSSQQAA